MIQVKQVVKLGSLVGGGLRETNLEVWGPLWWSQNHHKVGGVAVLSAAQGRYLPLQLAF